MTAQLLCGGTYQTSTGTTRYHGLTGGGAAGQATDTSLGFKLRAYYNFYHLDIYVYSNTCNNPATVLLHSTAGDTVLSVTVPANTTGRYQYNANSYYGAPNEYIMIKVALVGTGTLYITTASVIADGEEPIICANTGNTVNTTTYRSVYIPVSGGYTGNTYMWITEAYEQVRWHGESLLLGNLCACITANTTNKVSTHTLRIDGGDAGPSLSIAAATTGWFEDTVNTATIDDGEYINYKLAIDAAATGSLTTSSIGMSSLTTAGGTKYAYHPIFICTGNAALTSSGVYAGINGGSCWTSVLTAAYTYVKKRTTFKYTEIYIRTNASALLASTFCLVLDGATYLSVSVPAGATGFFENTSSVVIAEPGALVCYQYVAGGGMSTYSTFASVQGFETLPALRITPPLIYYQ